jgi:hypothetical protein
MPQSPDVTVDVSIPPPQARPNETAIRRALRRAADGATLDAAEATALLHAEGEKFEALPACAARPGSAPPPTRRFGNRRARAARSPVTGPLFHACPGVLDDVVTDMW